MKPFQLTTTIIPALCLLIALHTNAQETVSFRASSAENKVAVLPITYISEGSPLKTLEMRYRLQSIAHDYLRNGAIELKFQDPAETNALLRRHGVTEDNIRDFTPAELARFLNVEYLLSGMVVQDYVGQQTVRHTERREYERRGRTRRQSTGVSNTRDQMSTSIDLDMYNDKGENIFSKSRRSILSDIDAYKNGIHYLLK